MTQTPSAPRRGSRLRSLTYAAGVSRLVPKRAVGRHVASHGNHLITVAAEAAHTLADRCRDAAAALRATDDLAHLNPTSWIELGPVMNCSEVLAIARVLRAGGHDAAASSLIQAHETRRPCPWSHADAPAGPQAPTPMPDMDLSDSIEDPDLDGYPYDVA